MSDKKFKRGIDQDFIDVLNKLYKDGNNLWYEMRSDPDLFVAIRNNYVSVYFNGQSVGAFRFPNKKRIKRIKWKIHKKYLDVTESDYSEIVVWDINDGVSNIKSLPGLEQIKNVIKKDWFGKEKVSSYSEILKSGKNILDVEIALVEKTPTTRSGYKTSIIDYVALEEDRLVFYEAKHIDNQELNLENTPNVWDQINRYADSLKLHEDEIKSTYRNVLNNLNALDGRTDRKFKDPKFENKELRIDCNPNLIIFGSAKNKEKAISTIKRLDKKFGKQPIDKTT